MLVLTCIALYSINGASPGMLRMVEAPVAFFATGIFGLSHGALDPLLMRREGTARRFQWDQYVLLLAAGCLVWTSLPSIALICFLTTAVYHFGEGDVQSKSQSYGWTEVVARGVVFTIAIHVHSEEVSVLFGLIIGYTPVPVALSLVCSVMYIIYVCCTISFALHLITSVAPSTSRWVLLELAALISLYYIATPLTAFAVHFNLYHARRHVVRVMRMQPQSLGDYKKSILVATVVTAIPLFVLFAWVANTTKKESHITIDATAWVRPLFVILGTLTLPHGVLVHQTMRRNPDSY